MGDGTLGDFARTNMGWLTDGGALLVCRMHGHMERLETVPLFREAYWRYKDICDSNDEAMQQDLDSLGPDEHPAMHRFHGMTDGAKEELVKTVYTAGWVRLGRSFDTRRMSAAGASASRSTTAAFRDKSSWYVEAEGLTPAIRRHRKILEGIADGLGCRLETREMRYAQVNFGSASRPQIHELLVPETHGEPEPEDARIPRR